MLERNKYLTYENVFSLLTGTATAAGPANTYGAGKVNALNAMLATPAGLDCATISKLTGYDCDGNRVFSYQLEDAYPNPFNPSTSIGFRLLKSERADLEVYDVLGRLVRTLTNEVISEGYHTVVWDGKDDRGKDAASGVYFYHLSTPSFSAAHRLVLVR
jgi:hypothetical protein